MMEYLYHIDKNDTVLGKIEREEAHRKRLLHRAGVVFVFNSKGRTFLTRRSNTKRIFPGCVDCVCSFHVKHGQTYEEAAKVELLEETGIHGTPVFAGKYLLDKDPDHMYVAVFWIRHNGSLKLDPEEATEGSFYTVEEADRKIREEKITHWLPESWNIAKKAVSR